MARIEPVHGDGASAEVEAILREIEQAFGMVPNLFKTYAHHPPLLAANWSKVKAVMMAGSLSQKVKQAIAVLVSKDNGCAYCVAAHTAALKAIGVSSREIETIERNIEEADFSAKEKALIGFARAANLSPRAIGEAEIRALRGTGVSDAEVVEALGVMELFTAFNKFLDSLQVEIDF